jgi:hypothetical protein
MGCGVVIHTKKITSIEPTSVITGGEDIINADPILEKGIVWGTKPDLTIYNGTKLIDSDGSKDFSLIITGLIPSNVYYARAYATTLCCTTYGEEREFTTTSMAQDAGCLYVSYSIPAKASFVVPAGYEIVSVTDKTFLVSNCATDFTVDKFRCFGLYPFQGNNAGTPQTIYTKFISYEGLIINDIKYPFDTPIDHEASSEPSYTTAMNAVIDAIKTLGPYLQGLISDVSLCEVNEGDDGGYSRGVGAIIAIKGLANALTDARLYGKFPPQGDDKDYETEIQYPIYTKQQMFDNFGITTCNCPEEEITT